MKVVSYEFVVDDVKKIDLNRILSDQRKRGNDISLITSQNGNEYLLIHREFLSQFNLGDAQVLCGQILYPHWGYGTVTQVYSTQGFAFEMDNMTSSVDISLDGRIMKVDVPIPLVKKGLEKARAFRRRVKVSVRTL